jgi:hypothetical protein
VFVYNLSTNCLRSVIQSVDLVRRLVKVRRGDCFCVLPSLMETVAAQSGGTVCVTVLPPQPAVYRFVYSDSTVGAIVRQLVEVRRGNCLFLCSVITFENGGSTVEGDCLRDCVATVTCCLQICLQICLQ